MCKKCEQFGDEFLAVNICGIDIDPCFYDEIEVIKDCTVHILKCRRCGHIEIEWERQKEKQENSDDGY